MSEVSTAWWAIPLLFVSTGFLTIYAATLDRLLEDLFAGRGFRPRRLLSPFQDALRLLFKERTTTRMPDSIQWRLGPILVFTLPFLAAVVIPVAPGIAVTDLSTGIVWWTALMALLWVAVFLTGWSANSSFPLVAGYRYLAQALAYEMPLALVVITVGLLAESLQVSQIVSAQAEGMWFAVWAPLAFLVYLLAALAQTFWGPFSTPVADDLAGGVKAELSGVDRLLFTTGRHVALVVAAAFAVPLFLGGHHGPLLPGWLWILLKTLFVLTLLVSTRWIWPRIRIDRFEEFAWVVLIPLTLAQLFLVGALLLWGPS